MPPATLHHFQNLLFTHSTFIPQSENNLQGGPTWQVVRTLLFHCKGHRFNSGWGAKIPHVPLCSQKNNKTNKQQQQNPKALSEVKPQFEETEQASEQASLDMGGFFRL